MSVSLPIADRAESAPNSVVGISAVGLALLAIAIFTLTIFSPAVLGDGDTWSHLATGEWILAHRGPPRADPFSYTFGGAPWTAHEWLAEILLATAYRLAGWSGVVMATGLAASAAVLILGLRLSRDLNGVALIAVAALGVGLLTAGLLARPHVLALPVLAAWGSGLLAARDGGRAPPVALAAFMILWSNLHGGFAFGLALIAPFALEAVIDAPAQARLAAARDWALFALAALAAALINPYGFEALLFPFRLLGVANLAGVSEWAAQDFSRPGPMELALLALLGLALARPIRVPMLRALALVGLLHLALQHGRHQMLFGVLAPMLLARPLAQAFGLEIIPAERARVVKTTLTIACAATIALAFVRVAAPVRRVDGPSAPISAMKAVPSELAAKPVLNDYSFGGYLIWLNLRPFIDGRADMFGDAFLTRYGKIAGGDADALEAALKQYDIAWTIFTPDKRAVGVMDREPGWRRLYSDATAVVHVRIDALPEKPELRGDAPL